MDRCMDGLVGGWVTGQMGGCMDKWITDGWVDCGWISVMFDEWIDRWVRCVDG